MDVNEKIKLLLDGNAAPEEAVQAERDLTSRYPAFCLPTMLLLRHWNHHLTPEQRGSALRRVALFASDPLAVSRLENAESGYDGFYPPEPEPQTPSTENAIETFLENYGAPGAGSDAETAMLEKLIFNPVPQDYAETLRKDSDTDEALPHDTTTSRIDSFMSAHPAQTVRSSIPEEPEKESPKVEAEPATNALLSESLAKIYIKQHRYDKAFEIISQLSLNYPEKSVYFADQLRFLRKLMLIESRRKHKPSK